MQEKRKKFWIVFSITILSILAISFIFGMITNLDTVSIEFRQNLGMETKLDLEKIKEDGEFEYGKGLLFLNVNKSIEKIEKENPFAKVEQVVRKFPNILNVYISERVPCCYAKQGNNYVILDKEFKVLDVFADNAAGKENLATSYFGIYEINYSFVDLTLSEGDFVTDNGKMTLYKDVYLGIMGALGNKEEPDKVTILNNIISVKLKSSSALITMRKDNMSSEDKIEIKLEGINDLKIKTFTAIKFFNELEDTKSVTTIRIENAEDGTYKAYIDEES